MDIGNNPSGIRVRLTLNVALAPFFVAALAAGPVSAADLPAGYTQLDYIESTYKQAIRTGYTPTYGDRIECVVKLPTSRAQQQNWPTLFGTRTSAEAQRYYLRYNPADDSFRFGYASQEVEAMTGDAFDVGGYENGHAMRIVCQTNVLSWARPDGTHGGQIVASGTAPSMSVPLSIFCCGHGDVTWASGAANMRLYSFKVSNAAGLTQCDFVPCRRISDGAVGLYDTQRERFFSNESSNSFAGFTAAPVSSTLPSGYTRLAYIESTYKQALHTGYIPTWGDKIECDVKISSTHTGSYMALFGKQDNTGVNGYHFTIQLDGTQMIGYGNSSYYARTGEYFRSACNFLKGYDGGYLVHLTMQTNKVEWIRHDGTMYGSVSAPADATPPTMNREFCIFGANHQDNKWVTNPTNMRLYSFKVTAQDGTVQCEFIPCRRNSDGTIGLYDVVRDLFKQNESTASGAGGPFVAGHVYGSLPLGYRKADYIESTSALQYIDTGYLHGTNDLVAMEYYAPKDWQINGYCFLWGSKASGNTEPENWQFYIGGADNQNYISYNHKASSASTSPKGYDYTSDPIHLECQANVARWTCGTQNGSYETASSYADWTNGKYPMYIFSGDVAGSVGGSFCTVMRLYFFKIYRDIGDEMVLVHDFVPMIAASGAVGLYDRVGDRFHANMRANVADFNVGVDFDALPEGYKKVEYIQSTDALQYIDTGYWHGTNDLVVMEYFAPKTWQVNGYCYLWGSRMPSSGNHTHAVNWHFYIGGAGNQNYISYNHYTGKSVQNPAGYDYSGKPIHLECQASTATFTCGGNSGSLTTTGTFANWTEGKWPLYIFTGNCGGEIERTYCSVMRLYWFKLYRDIGGRMVLVRDFVPVLDPTGAAGLFDLVERRFYGNAREGVPDFKYRLFNTPLIMTVH